MASAPTIATGTLLNAEKILAGVTVATSAAPLAAGAFSPEQITTFYQLLSFCLVGGNAGALANMAVFGVVTKGHPIQRLAAKFLASLLSSLFISPFLYSWLVKKGYVDFDLPSVLIVSGAVAFCFVSTIHFLARIWPHVEPVVVEKIRKKLNKWGE